MNTVREGGADLADDRLREVDELPVGAICLRGNLRPQRMDLFEPIEFDGFQLPRRAPESKQRGESAPPNEWICLSRLTLMDFNCSAVTFFAPVFCSREQKT